MGDPAEETLAILIWDARTNVGMYAPMQDSPLPFPLHGFTTHGVGRQGVLMPIPGMSGRMGGSAAFFWVDGWVGW